MLFKCKKIWIVVAVVLLLFQVNITLINGKNLKNSTYQTEYNEFSSYYTSEIEWELTLGGPEFDACYSVKQTEDGGFVFAGGSYSFGPGLSDLWIIKTDDSGNIVWNKTYGGPRNESCYSIQKTLDGCYIVAGKTKVVEPDNFDAILLKIDSDGNELWNKTYGGEQYDGSWWVEPTLDGGYILVGYTESNGDDDGDIWVIKTDANGELVWDKTFGGDKFEEAEEVLVLDDGSYIIVGSTESFGSGGKDLWIFKIDSYGSLIWEKIYGGSLNDEGWSIELTEDNCYFILGRTFSYGAGAQDFWLIKTDNKGDIILNRTFGGDYFDQARRIQKANDGSYLLIGTTESFDANEGDYWLIAIDENGYALWDLIIDYQDFEIGYEVQQSQDSGYILTGVTYNPSNHGDAWFVKLYPYENQQPSKPDKPEGKTQIKPNQYYPYSTVSKDFDNDEIFYQWDWGDGSFSNWVGPFKSNEVCEESHNWSEKANYQIKVRAKDSKGGESQWSDPLEVNVPRIKYDAKNQILAIFDFFKFFYPLIRLLL